MRKILLSTTCAALVTALAPVFAAGADDNCEEVGCKNRWQSATASEVSKAMQLGEQYKSFLSVARTEELTVKESIRLLKKEGFKEWQGRAVKAGQRYYLADRDRSLFVIVGGGQPISEGVRIISSHIDSPRIDVRARPLYEKEGYAMFQTTVHGGIKSYQWTNIPLALVGRVDKKDGETVEISIGLNANDPVFVIADLAPHVSYKQREKKISDAIEHDQLDPILATGPQGENTVVQGVLAHLKSSYGIEQADLVSAELSLVPAMAPRDVGFDKRLVGAFGQDDRASAFASMMGAIDAKNLPHTAIVHFTDNEETGGYNVTGLRSSALVDLIGELLYADQGSNYPQPVFTRAIKKSRAMWADVPPGINPMDASVWEVANAPRLGHGITLNLYGMGSNANSEYIAWMRAALDGRDIPWQTSAYKSGLRKGGPAGKFISARNIETVDVGMPIMSIHTPFALSDKMDVLALKNTSQAFLEFSR